MEEWVRAMLERHNETPPRCFTQGGTVVVVVADASAARSINMRNHSRGVGNPWGFAGAAQLPASLVHYTTSCVQAPTKALPITL